MTIQKYSARKEEYRPNSETVLQVENGIVVFNFANGHINCAEHDRTMIYNEQNGLLSCPICSTAAAVKYLTEFE